jgi:hypothetical protein
MIQTCVKHFATCRAHGFSSINKTQRLPFEKNSWTKVAARVIVKRQATVLDLSAAITTTTLAKVRLNPPGEIGNKPSDKVDLANHQNPPEGLRQRINEGRDVRSIIDSRRREREVAETEGTDYRDRFPAFTARFSSYKYPEGFKPIGITKYDGKQAPQQWLHCYSTAIEVAGGSNITKVVYFPMALDLSNNSIDSWERLKKVFIDNFQGAITRAGTRHDLAQCK